MPKVSIIMATYNGAAYIAEALESIRAQTYTDYEIIIVDDGSTDKTQDVLKSYQNDIRYFYKENEGVSKARLYGLERAQGEYIALLDQDDLWVPDKLARQVAFLNAYPDVNFIFSDFQNFNERGFIERSYFTEHTGIRRIKTVPAEKAGRQCKLLTGNILYEYLRGNFIIQCTMLARKTTCEKFKMFVNKTNGREQYEFSTRALHLLKIGFIDDVLAHRRIHRNNLTHDLERYCKNTIIICTNAIEYPWMDNRCKAFLRRELKWAYCKRAQYYIVNGKLNKARATLHELLAQHPFCIKAYIFLLATYVLSPKTIAVLKTLREYPKLAKRTT